MTWYRVGPAGIPGSLKTDMNTILNKKFGTTAQDYPPAGWPADVNLMGPLPEKTASGSIAHIEDGADEVPVKNWLVTLSASLTGYSEVNGTKAGKNLFDYEAVEAFNANVIITRSDGDYTMQNNNNYVVGAFRGILFHLKPATYSMSLGEAISVPIRIYKNGSWFNNGINAGNTSCAFTVTEEADYEFSCNVAANSSLTIKKFQFEVGSTATAYTAYEAPTQYTASLGRTIYGGEADIVTGEGEDDGVIEVFDAVEGNVIKSQFNSFNKVNGNIAVLGTNVRITFAIESGDQSAYNRISNTYTTGEQLCNLAPHSFSYASDTTHWYRNTVLYLFLPVADVGTTAESVYNYLTGLITNGTPLKFFLPYNIPTDFTFTPITADTELGTNNFWADEGDSEVTYRADISLALNA